MRKRTDWGVSFDRRHGIFIGTPRLLDITWGGACLLTVKTHDHYLRLRPFHVGRYPR